MKWQTKATIGCVSFGVFSYVFYQWILPLF